MTLRFEVPGKPQPKQRPRRSSKGVWYTPAPTKRYESSVAYRAALAARNQHWRKTSDQVVMRVAIFWPDKRRRDADNLLKSVQDGISKSGVIWDDDCQCLPQVVCIEVDRENPRVEVEMEMRL